MMSLKNTAQSIWNAVGLPGVIAIAAILVVIAYGLGMGRKKPTVLETIADRVTPHPSIMETIADRVTPHPSVMETIADRVTPHPSIMETIADRVTPHPTVKDRVAKAAQPIISAVDGAVDGLGPRLTHAPSEALDAIKNTVVPR
jgi:hypothetical protein